MAIHEECGVFGVMSTRRENVAGAVYYGTDIDSEENLIACQHSMEEIGEMIGVDSLGYLPLERLNQLVDSVDYCAACFNGEYPTAIPTDLRKDRFERKLCEKTS